MFKTLTFFMITSFMGTALAAKPCKVYGISDSPQSLHCAFPDQIVELTCQDGHYFLNATQVTMAFHMEVETGPVPLVFKSPGMTLTVVMGNPTEAQLSENKSEVSGTCQSK